MNSPKTLGVCPVHDLVTIRNEPSPADLNRLCKIAADTVHEIARMDGALGHDSIALLYAQRLYAGVVACAVKEKRHPK